MRGVFQALLKALEDGEAVALATVVKAVGSTPRHQGAKMLIRADGSTIGTVGGAALERQVIQDAQAALAEGRSRLVSYSLSGKGPDSLGLCGGTMDIFIDVIQPEPKLVIIGAGHIALPLAKLGKMLGLRVAIVDDRPDFANAERFPEADEIAIVPYHAQEQGLDPILVEITPSTSVVIATWGYDEPALKQMLGSKAAYIGLVASRRKAKIIFDNLRQQGVEETALGRVHAPAGLDLGAETPAEIALSIIAEILMLQRGGSGEPL